MAPTLPMLGLDELTAFQNQAAANNPLLSIAPAVGQARFDMRTWDPMAQLGTSFAQSFLSGALGAIGRNQVADQVRAVAPLLPQLYNSPDLVSAPEGVDPAAFEGLKSAAGLRALQRQSLVDQIAMELLGDGTKNALKGLSSGNPLEVEQSRATLNELSKSRLGRQLGLSSIIDQAGEGRRPKIDPAEVPGTPEYQRNLDLDSRITNARDYLRNSEEGRGLSNLKPALQQVVSNLDRNDKRADLAVFTALAKAIDPVGAISDQTIRTTQDAIPYIERQFGSTKGFFTGDGTLTRDAKLKILEVVADKANTYASAYGGLVANERKRLEALRADPNLLTTLDYSPFDVSSVMKTTPVDPLSAIDAELARRGFNPDGSRITAPLPAEPLRVR